MAINTKYAEIAKCVRSIPTVDDNEVDISSNGKNIFCSKWGNAMPQQLFVCHDNSHAVATWKSIPTSVGTAGDTNIQIQLNELGSLAGRYDRAGYGLQNTEDGGGQYGQQ
ncbi:hypothetical protein HED60_13835 [Planctomycetales bacterium ZRK34]|nr:hypothetical protein HED60_13835 [Planctomycetales bacterium ZRK34]